MNASLTGKVITDNTGLNVRKLTYGKSGDGMKDDGTFANSFTERYAHG